MATQKKNSSSTTAVVDEKSVTVATPSASATIEQSGARPVDADAAERLQIAVRTFNAGAVDRTVLTGEERRKLDEISELASNLGEAEKKAVGFDVFRAESKTAGIRARVGKYVEVTLGVVNLPVGAEVIAAPAIESGAVRRYLVDEGQAVLQELEAYIEIARVLDSRKRDAFAEQVAALAGALRIPEFAAIFIAFDTFRTSALLNRNSEYVRRIVENVHEALQMPLTMARERGQFRHTLQTHDKKEFVKVIEAWRLVKAEKANAA